jgi:hypothetical protein
VLKLPAAVKSGWHHFASLGAVALPAANVGFGVIVLIKLYFGYDM